MDFLNNFLRNQQQSGSKLGNLMTLTGLNAPGVDQFRAGQQLQNSQLGGAMRTLDRLTPGGLDLPPQLVPQRPGQMYGPAPAGNLGFSAPGAMQAPEAPSQQPPIGLQPLPQADLMYAPPNPNGGALRKLFGLLG